MEVFETGAGARAEEEDEDEEEEEEDEWGGADTAPGTAPLLMPRLMASHALTDATMNTGMGEVSGKGARLSLTALASSDRG